jgi:quercetin dioxygenase-like cupin family protein
VKVVRAGEVDELAAVQPHEPNGLHMKWLEGPVAGAQLDVGLVTLRPEGAAPPHAHHGGQLIVVLTGRGFVETGGERVEVGPGDVVISPPGEMHTHGATGGQPMAHLTVTTGGYDLPGEPPATSKDHSSE